MGNKIKFIIDYHQYLSNIENLSKIDDILIFESFKKQSKNGYLVLSEGLISTHSVNKSASIIKKRFPNLEIEIEIDGEIYIEGQFDEIVNYIPLFNNLGYFISTYTIDGSNWIKEFNDHTKPVALYLEPIYDLEIDPIPSILYHTSPSKFKNKFHI